VNNDQAFCVWEGETMAQLSRDQELVKQLKRRFNTSFFHLWVQEYDKEGRLLKLSPSGPKFTLDAPELWQLTSLQTLYLDNHQLTSLPTELFQLTNLQMLGLHDNQLSSLPAELGQLTNLRDLNLNNNQLSSLPAELFQLTNLRELDLNGNQLGSLPAELGQLTKLEWLWLSNNRLTNLPAELGQLLNLHLLELEFNRLTNLPAELGQLVNLKVLRLSHNQLTNLPAELSQLTNLEQLSLSENPQLFIPPREVVRRGIPAILAYLRTLPRTVECFEAKQSLAGERDITFPGSTKALSSAENDGNQRSLSGNVPTDEISREKSNLNTKETVPIKVFYCYAHEDKALRDRIDKHLGVLKRLGYVVGWYDREIQAGTEWEREIEENLSTANLILLLVSADFIASDYCYGVEMTKALELHRAGQARVLPILLRSVDWQDAPFATLQMLPTGAKPIMQWMDQDEALEDVAKGIRNVVSSLRSQKK
jgi:hypothetical protein